MKLRGSARPSTINTQTRTQSRKSVDDDFAPSVTPSSAETDFPRYYPYYPPKDPTWWPKQHPTHSPEPVDPHFKLHKYKPIADPNFRPRRSASGSSADAVRAPTGKPKMKTRSGASTETQVHDEKKREHKTKRRSRKRSNPLKSAVKFDTGTLVRATTRQDGGQGKVMTTDNLQRIPLSPKTAPYIIEGRDGAREVMLTKKDIRELKKQAQSRRLSSLVFEKKHGHRRALHNGVKEPLASPKTATRERWTGQAATKRHSFAAGDEGAASETRSESFRNPSSAASASTSGFSQYVPPRTRSLSQPPSLPHGPYLPTSQASSFTANKRRLSSLGNEDLAAKRSRQTVTDQFAEATWDSLRQHLHVLEDSPQELRLETVGPLFMYLQTHIQDFADEHFSFRLSPEESAAWPLHQLSSTYLPLMLVTQYIADGSQYGWQKFFTNPSSRSALVYGIIGEWLRQRVFNHTCFGMRDDQVEMMENHDRKYLHHDAFMRSKKRGLAVRLFTLPNADNVPYSTTNDITATLNKACEELADELMVVLTPLMPSEVFGYNPQTRSFAQNTGAEADHTKSTIRASLTNLIRMAAVFHRAIRVLGETGTIVRIAPTVTKGHEYHATAPFVVVNESMVEETKHHADQASGNTDGTGDKAKLTIKMTCFPRVEAYVPHGPDHAELAKIEARERRLLKEKGEDPDTFSWESHVERVWPKLPEEAMEYQKRKFGENAELWERGSFVTSYTKLCPHQVYCEWEPRKEFDEETETEAEKGKGKDKGKGKGKDKGKDKGKGKASLKGPMADQDVVLVGSETDPDNDSDATTYSDDDNDDGDDDTNATPPRPRRHDRFSAPFTDRNHAHAHAHAHGLPLPETKRVSLQEAIKHARRNVKPWKHALEDVVRDTWNFGCKYEGLMELVVGTPLTVWFIACVLRGGVVDGGVVEGGVVGGGVVGGGVVEGWTKRLGEVMVGYAGVIGERAGLLGDMVWENVGRGIEVVKDGRRVFGLVKQATGLGMGEAA